MSLASYTKKRAREILAAVTRGSKQGFPQTQYGVPSPIMPVPPIIDAVKAFIGFALEFQYYFFETKNLFFAHGYLFKAECSRCRLWRR